MTCDVLPGAGEGELIMLSFDVCFGIDIRCYSFSLSLFCTMVVVEMEAMGMPWPLVLVVLLLQWTQNVSHTPIGFAEFFAGHGEQSKALGDVGLQGHAHDLSYGKSSNQVWRDLLMCVHVHTLPLHAHLCIWAGHSLDFCANSGFALAINSVSRLLPGSIAPLGPVCSSWIFVKP